MAPRCKRKFDSSQNESNGAENSTVADTPPNLEPESSLVIDLSPQGATKTPGKRAYKRKNIDKDSIDSPNLHGVKTNDHGVDCRALKKIARQMDTFHDIFTSMQSNIVFLQNLTTRLLDHKLASQAVEDTLVESTGSLRSLVRLFEQVQRQTHQSDINGPNHGIIPAHQAEEIQHEQLSVGHQQVPMSEIQHTQPKPSESQHSKQRLPVQIPLHQIRTSCNGSSDLTQNTTPLPVFQVCQPTQPAPRVQPQHLQTDQTQELTFRSLLLNPAIGQPLDENSNIVQPMPSTSAVTRAPPQTHFLAYSIQDSSKSDGVAQQPSLPIQQVTSAVQQPILSTQNTHSQPQMDIPGIRPCTVQLTQVQLQPDSTNLGTSRQFVLQNIETSTDGLDLSKSAPIKTVQPHPGVQAVQVVRPSVGANTPIQLIPIKQESSISKYTPSPETITSLRKRIKEQYIRDKTAGKKCIKIPSCFKKGPGNYPKYYSCTPNALTDPYSIVYVSKGATNESSTSSSSENITGTPTNCITMCADNNTNIPQAKTSSKTE